MSTNPGIEPKCEITNGERNPSCECMTCQEYRLAIKMPKNGKILYCMAFTYWCPQRKQWIGEKSYTHAFDVEEARGIFYQAEIKGAMRVIDVKGVAPVIGYFVNDKQGMELSV